MLTATAVFHLTLLVGLACAVDQHSLPATGRLDKKPSSPASQADKQSNRAQQMDEMIYQSAIEFPDWPLEGAIVLNTRMSEDNDTEVDQHSTEEETSNSKPIEHLPDTFDTFKPQYTLVDGLGYYKVVKGHYLSWEKARAACRAEGAHLAVINSRREADALRNLYYNFGIKTDLVNYTAWIGAYRPRGQHQFITVHGTQMKKVGYNAWKNEKHDKGTEERCVELDVHTDLKLTSSSCDWGRHHICEHQL